MSIQPPPTGSTPSDPVARAAAVPGRAGHGRFQFTLGMLFSLTAAVSLFMGVWAWRGPRGALQLCLAAALGVVAVGLYRRRARLIAAGLVLFGAILCTLWLAGKYTYTLARTTPVTVMLRVRVVDAATNSPIQLATVRLTGSAAAPEPAATGADGTADFTLHMTCTESGVGSVITWTRERTVNPWMDLTVEAGGYEPVKRWLPDDLGRRCPIEGDRLPEVRVPLVRAPAKGPPKPPPNPDSEGGQGGTE